MPHPEAILTNQTTGSTLNRFYSLNIFLRYTQKVWQTEIFAFLTKANISYPLPDSESTQKLSLISFLRWNEGILLYVCRHNLCGVHGLCGLVLLV